jgi:hypothetical protein
MPDELVYRTEVLFASWTSGLHHPDFVIHERWIARAWRFRRGALLAVPTSSRASDSTSSTSVLERRAIRHLHIDCFARSASSRLKLRLTFPQSVQTDAGIGSFRMLNDSTSLTYSAPRLSPQWLALILFDFAGGFTASQN